MHENSILLGRKKQRKAKKSKEKKNDELKK
jgi:hypothetical protein